MSELATNQNTGQMYKLVMPEIVPETKQDGSDSNSGVIKFRFITSTIDRGRHKMSMEGMKYDSIKNNPVFLWMHDLGAMFGSSVPAIGNIVIDKLSVGKNYADVPVQFDLEDPFAESIYGKYKRGIMKAVSIGWIPLKSPELMVEGKNEKDESAEDIYGKEYFLFKEWEWVELSAVNVGMNPEALRKSYLDNSFDNMINKFNSLVEQKFNSLIVPAQSENRDASLNIIKAMPDDIDTELFRIYEMAKSITDILKPYVDESERDKAVSVKLAESILQPFKELKEIVGN